MNFRRVRAVLVAAAVAAAATPALAQDTAEDEDQVLARVDGEPILRSEVLTAAKGVVEQFPGQIDRLLPMLLERAITVRLIADASRAAGLADDPEFQRRKEELEAILMQEMYLDRKIKEAVTDERLREAYQSYLEAHPPQPEIHARHILVDTEDEAKAAIARLDKGEDFAALAEELSKGPSAERGGDLDYFTEDQMVEPFAKAAFALEPGQHSMDPVQTEFGWHVIKVEDRREAAAPALEEVEEQLREELSREVLTAVVAELREKADIEVLLPEPAPEPEPPAETGGEGEAGSDDGGTEP
jgi:peptidyl-prolyl cis-trans isomerase C